MINRSSVRALLLADFQNIGRDPFLRWFSFIALGFAVAIRLGVPPLTAWLEREHGIALQPYYNLIMSLNLTLAPLLAGIVLGFLLLDQRDDRTLEALQVTPLGLRGYLRYRLLASMIGSTVLTVLVMVVAGLDRPPMADLLVLSVAIAPLAPFFALFLAAFATNKVQGMALTKANSLLTLPPLVSFFVPGPWQYAFGLVPTYWPVRAYWEVSQGNWLYLPYALVGMLLLSVGTALMLRRFLRVAVR